jgi:hypothetical protein
MLWLLGRASTLRRQIVVATPSQLEEVPNDANIAVLRKSERTT